MSKMPPALFALALCAFPIGTTELVIVGLLPEVSTDLGVTIPTAGLLVTGYAFYHFVRVGKGIFRQKNRLEEQKRQFSEIRITRRTSRHLHKKVKQYKKQWACWNEANGCLKNAYRFLLDGKALDAEVELERAKDSPDKAYAAYVVRAGITNWWKRASTGASNVRARAAGTLVLAFKRPMFLPALAIVIVTPIALVLIISFLKRTS